MKYKSKEIIQTRFGHVLTEHEKKAYKTIKRIIEHDETMGNRTTKSHAMADIFRSYFKAQKIDPCGSFNNKLSKHLNS